MNAVAIRDVIQSIVDKMSYMNGYKKAWMEKQWFGLVGEEASKHSKPYRVERDILFVNVDSSAWNQELFMNRANLISKINKKFARKIVEEVKYQIGHFTVVEEKLDSVEVENDIEFKISLHDIRRDVAWDKNILKKLQQKKMFVSGE